MTETTPHPSEFIQDELAARNWDMVDLAIKMGGDAVRNTMVLDLYFVAGPSRPNMRISEKMAQQFSHAFGVSSEYFHNLENMWLAGRLTPTVH